MEQLNRSLSPFGEMLLSRCQLNGRSKELTETVLQGVEWVEKNVPSLQDPKQKHEVVMLFAQKRLAEESASQSKKSFNDVVEVMNQQRETFQKASGLIDKQQDRIQELQTLLLAKGTTSQN